MDRFLFEVVIQVLMGLKLPKQTTTSSVDFLPIKFRAATCHNVILFSSIVFHFLRMFYFVAHYYSL